MELRSPNFATMSDGDEIFGNLPEELQKKYEAEKGGTPETTEK